MSESANNPSAKPGALLPVVSLLALLFAGLWLAERFKTSAIKVREVVRPVETARTPSLEWIREVPAEPSYDGSEPMTNAVEVPAGLTDAQRAALEFVSNYVAAPNLSAMDGALYKMESLCLKVKLQDEISRVAAEDQIKNRCEAILKRSGITLDDHSPHLLGINYEGLWDETETLLTYSLHLELYDSVTLDHQGDLRRAYAIVWIRNFLGAAELDAAPQAILSNVETNVESFAAKFRSLEEK